MIKCSSKGKKFEYVYEARLVVLPPNWKIGSEVLEVPAETQQLL